MLYGALLAFLLMQPIVDNLARKWNLKKSPAGTIESPAENPDPSAE